MENDFTVTTTMTAVVSKSESLKVLHVSAPFPQVLLFLSIMAKHEIMAYTHQKTGVNTCIATFTQGEDAAVVENEVRGSRVHFTGLPPFHDPIVGRAFSGMPIVFIPFARPTTWCKRVDDPLKYSVTQMRRFIANRGDDSKRCTGTIEDCLTKITALFPGQWVRIILYIPLLPRWTAEGINRLTRELVTCVSNLQRRGGIVTPVYDSADNSTEGCINLVRL